VKNGLSRKVVKGLSLANTTDMQFALVAAREAWADAGKPGVEPERLGVVVSSGVGGVAFGWADALEAVPTILALREAVARPPSTSTIPMTRPVSTSPPSRRISSRVAARRWRR
jgi:3-oxoacyl-[acyl-carrier-protein] synthase II